MAIRKGKLYRICKKCKKEYEPNGKYNKLCPDCLPHQNNTFWNRMRRLSRRKKSSHNQNNKYSTTKHKGL